MALARGLIALALLTPMLATGCVAPRVEAESVTLTFACHDHEVLHYRSLVEAFQADHPGMVIRLASVDEIADQFPEHPGGEIGRLAEAVDAFVAAAPDPRLSLDGVLLDLTPYAQAEGLYPGDELFTGPVAPFARGGRLYGLPHQAHAYVLFYDPEAFARAGLSPPRPGWTRDDLLRAAVATTERQGDATVRYGFVDRWPGYTIAALSESATTAGAETPLRLEAAALADTLLWYADLVRVHQAAPDASAPDAQEAAETFLLGERPPAMWTGHSFEAGRYRKRYGAEVAPLPEGARPAPPIVVDGYMVSAGTLHPEAAWRWVEFLSRQPSAAYYGGVIARRSGAYWEGLDEGTADTFRYCLEHGAYYDPEVWTLVQAALLGVLRGEPLGEVMERGPWIAAPTEGRGDSATSRGETGASYAARAVAAPVSLPETGGREPTTIRFGVRSGQDAGVYRLLADRLALERSGIAVEVVGPDEPADCFVAGADVIRHASERRLAPVDRYLSGVRLAQAYPRPLLDPLRVQGHIWALPLDADARVLVYNRNNFDAAGLTYPSETWTAQDLVEHAALLAAPTADTPRYGYWPRGGAAFHAGEMIAWLGGSLLGEDGRPTLDTPTAAAAMRRYLDLIDTAPPVVAPDEANGVVLPWGSYPAIVEGGWVAMWLDDYASAGQAAGRLETLGLAPLPRGAVTPPPTLERVLYISAWTPQPEACWEWLWYLGGRPEATDLLPARREVASSGAWRQRVGDEVADAWLATLARLDDGGGAWGPYSDGTTLGWVDRAFVEVLQGAEPAEALARAQEEALVYAECMASGEGAVVSWEVCLGVAEGRHEAARAD